MNQIIRRLREWLWLINDPRSLHASQLGWPVTSQWPLTLGYQNWGSICPTLNKINNGLRYIGHKLLRMGCQNIGHISLNIWKPNIKLFRSVEWQCDAPPICFCIHPRSYLLLIFIYMRISEYIRDDAGDSVCHANTLIMLGDKPGK